MQSVSTSRIPSWSDPTVLHTIPPRFHLCFGDCIPWALLVLLSFACVSFRLLSFGVFVFCSFLCLFVVCCVVFCLFVFCLFVCFVGFVCCFVCLFFVLFCFVLGSLCCSPTRRFTLTHSRSHWHWPAVVSGYFCFLPKLRSLVRPDSKLQVQLDR